MFHVCVTFCSDYVERSDLFNKTSLFSIEMIYKLLDCMQKSSDEVIKRRIMERLYFMIYDKDSSQKLIDQISQRIYELDSEYHWYQLIVWNNFLHALLGIDDPQWTSKRSSIRFAPTQRQKQDNNTKHKNKRGLNDENDSSEYENSFDMSVISLVSIDYLIETLFGNEQRNYPLEVKVIEMLEKWSLEIHERNLLATTHVSSKEKESVLFASKAALERSQIDAFDILCNVLAVFGKNCAAVIVSNSNIIHQLLRIQAIPFDAVFDMFDRLKIHEIYGATRNNGERKPVPKAERKEENKQKENTIDATRGGVTSFFVTYFGRYVKNIHEEGSKDRLYKLLTKYKWFISSSSSGDLKKKFYRSIAANPNVFFDPPFIPPIKHIFKQFSDDEMHEWYLQYWDEHGIKAVIDIIYQCEFKFETFCDLIKSFPKRLQDSSICKFEEWVEVIVCRNIRDATKLIICENPPLRFKDIVNIKDKKQKQDYLDRLKLVLVEDDPKKAQEFGFGPGLEMPLIKYNKRAPCNRLLQHLMDDAFPDFNTKDGVYQDKKIISFFAGNVGQQLIKFLNQIIQIVKGNQVDIQVPVEL